MPATNGSATPSVAPTATAASIALPPWRSTSSPAEVASTSSDATAPPVPTATACLGRSLTVCLSVPADAGRLAEPEPTSRAATDAAVSTPARNGMSIPPDGWPGALIRGRTYPLKDLSKPSGAVQPSETPHQNQGQRQRDHHAGVDAQFSHRVGQRRLLAHE